MFLKIVLLSIRAASYACLVAASAAAASDSLPPLPEPVSNNAVASLQRDGNTYIASFSGLSSGLSHADIHARTFVLRSDQTEWQQAPDVPGGAGRLASVAISVGERMYVFGGYSVDAEGGEVSTPWVHQFDPVKLQFTEMSPMPVPVDDTVAVSYQDRYIYLISGWHDYGNVNLVQVFDTQTNTWAQATPVPGNSLFGHSGGIVQDQMLFCDGVAIRANRTEAREFVASDECYVGKIDGDNHRRIDWHPVDAHPGQPRYRMAAAGNLAINSVVFVGGSETPYNFNGIGYNGAPSEPVAQTLIFDLGRKQWAQIESRQTPSMDHRGLVRFENTWYTIGGMLSNQTVTGNVLSHPAAPHE